MKAVLDELYARFDAEKFSAGDPCGVVRELMRHTDSQMDIEIGALLVAVISWGSRKVFIPVARHMLRDEMKWHPAEFVMSGAFEHSYQDAKKQCVYRTLNVPTFQQICRNLCNELQDHATMEQRLAGLSSEEAIAEICRWLEPAKIGTPGKSACKRVCMFLRWMVRHEKPDFGLWTSRSQSDLYAILDTHVCQLTAPLLENSSRSSSSPTWKTCTKLTEIFKSWDAEDPLKYDVALMTLADAHK